MSPVTSLLFIEDDDSIRLALTRAGPGDERSVHRSVPAGPGSSDVAVGA